MKTSEYIGRLLFLHLRGKTNKAQDRELDQWRAASPNNEKIFQLTRDPEWLRTRLTEINDAREYVGEKLAVEFPYLRKKKKAVVVKMSWRKKLRNVACIAGLCLCMKWYHETDPNRLKPATSEAGFLSFESIKREWYDFETGAHAGAAHLERIIKDNGEVVYIYSDRTNRRVGQTFDLFTHEGEEFSLYLPDSTIIHANPSTSITFPQNFSVQDSIRIRFEGEAFFEIAPGSKPYIIQIGKTQGSLRESGKFIITAYPDEPVAESHDSLQMLAWKNNMVYFDQVPIKTIMNYMHTWYKAEVSYLGTPPDWKFNLSISRSAEISDLLDSLSSQGLANNRFKKNIILFTQVNKK